MMRGQRDRLVAALQAVPALLVQAPAAHLTSEVLLLMSALALVMMMVASLAVAQHWH